MSIEEIKTCWNKVSNEIELAKIMAVLVETSFVEGFISHYRLAPCIGLHPDTLAIEILNTGWNRKVAPDKGMQVHYDLVHRLLLNYSPLYQEADKLGKEGILIYRREELNKLLGYALEPSIDMRTIL